MLLEFNIISKTKNNYNYKNKIQSLNDNNKKIPQYIYF